ncbi:hypothetical protein [Methanocella sp. MCL-LM]|uniref:hypothetical protein n=1 Tax=Methanocella sp. MCL-LM TaxID=3412035 RepID=UPI003C75081E
MKIIAFLDKFHTRLKIGPRLKPGEVQEYVDRTEKRTRYMFWTGILAMVSGSLGYVLLDDFTGFMMWGFAGVLLIFMAGRETYLVETLAKLRSAEGQKR